MMKNIKVFLYLIPVFAYWALCAEVEKKTFARDDQSQAQVFISIPDLPSFPLLIYLDGSLEQSVKSNFSQLEKEFVPQHIGLVAIEKRGISEKEINLPEFFDHDCFGERFQDYYLLVKELKKGLIANWNGQLIFMGSSEGGKIAPKLTRFFADHAVGTILLSSGGGLPFAEEIKHQIRQQQLFYFGEEWFKLNDFDALMENKFAEIAAQPDSLQKYYGKTYKWFASHSSHNLLANLLAINSPILLIHGTRDLHIPIESAERVKIAFDEAGKNNLQYIKFEEMGHSIAGVSSIFSFLVEWSKSLLLNSAEKEPALIALPLSAYQ